MGASWEPINAFKLYEVVDYFNNVKLCSVYFSIVMNKSKWNSLGQSNQEAIMNVSGLEGAKFFGRNWFDSAKEQVFRNIKKDGANITEITPSEEEQDRFLKIGSQPVWDAWVASMEGKGHKNARAILNTTLELLK